MNHAITVLDGGMGRELHRIGGPFRQPEWSALALTEGPEWVVQAHTNFIDAGADVITTNSYAIVPFHIGEHRFAGEATELAGIAGECARAAVDGSLRPVRVAGGLPPLFGSYRPDLFDRDDAPRIIDQLVAGLSPHVDLWLGETLGSIAEAYAVREALDRIDDRERPMWISFTLDDGHQGALRSGESIADAVAVASDLGAAAILFNCSQAETIGRAIPAAVDAARAPIAIGGYANRFVASHSGSGEANEQISDYRDDVDPEAYSAHAAGWLEAGATIIGGCCGIGPQHIAEIARLGRDQ